MQVRRLFREEGASVRGRVRRIPPRQLEPGHHSHSRRERDVPAGGAVVRGNQARFGLADLRDDEHEHDEHDDEDEDEDDVQNDQDQNLESGHGNVDDDPNNDEDVNSSSGLGSEEYEIHYQHGSEDGSEDESENDTDDDEFLYGDGGNNDDDDDENSRTHLFGEIPRVRLSFEGTWEVLGGW